MSTTSSTGQQWSTDFVERVYRKVRDDGAARAALRTGFRRKPADSPRMHQYVIPVGGKWDSDYAVAAWVARFNSRGTPDVTLGDAVRRAAGRRGASDPIFKRATDLGRVSEDLLLNNRLPSLLTLLDSRGRLPDMGLLLWNVKGWSSYSGRVFRSWMNDLYRPERPLDDVTSETNSSTNESSAP